MPLASSLAGFFTPPPKIFVFRQLFFAAGYLSFLLSFMVCHIFSGHHHRTTPLSMLRLPLLSFQLRCPLLSSIDVFHAFPLSLMLYFLAFCFSFKTLLCYIARGVDYCAQARLPKIQQRMRSVHDAIHGLPKIRRLPITRRRQPSCSFRQPTHHYSYHAVERRGERVQKDTQCARRSVRAAVAQRCAMPPDVTTMTQQTR